MTVKELNHKINMQYRQLGKVVFEELKEEEDVPKAYKKQIKVIRKLILEIEKHKVIDEEDGDDDDSHLSDLDEAEVLVRQKVIEKEKALEAQKTNEGFTLYQFCPKCQAGNHPQASYCIRCHQSLKK
jgi:ribosomal protein L40E